MLKYMYCNSCYNPLPDDRLEAFLYCPSCTYLSCATCVQVIVLDTEWALEPQEIVVCNSCLKEN